MNLDFWTFFVLVVSAIIALASFVSVRAAHKRRVTYDHLFQIVTNENFLKCEEAFVLAAQIEEINSDKLKAKAFVNGDVRAWPLSFAALTVEEAENFIKHREDAGKIFRKWRRWSKSVIAYVNQCELLCVSITYGVIDEDIAKAHFGSELVDRFDEAMRFIEPIRLQGDGSCDGEYYVYFQTVAENWRRGCKINSLPKPPGAFFRIWRQIDGSPKEYLDLPKRLRKKRAAGTESA